jgi:hypothetical protein
MQTFMPFKSFYHTAQALDNKRLNKQILECYQILKVLSSDDPKAGWRNHPAVKMWKGFEMGLFQYAMVMIEEANKRGIRTENNLRNLNELNERAYKDWGYGMPLWMDDKKVMARVTTTHKANLYLKDPIFYTDFINAVANKNNEPCCDKCSYYWVTHNQVKSIELVNDSV